jgi:hypothetical protein
VSRAGGRRCRARTGCLAVGRDSLVRVAVGVAATATAKPFPKSTAGRWTVPLPPFVVELPGKHRANYSAGQLGEVFTNQAGGPMRRSLFRSRVWRPALVRAGLLGRIEELGEDKCGALSGPTKTAWSVGRVLHEARGHSARRRTNPWRAAFPRPSTLGCDLANISSAYRSTTSRRSWATNRHDHTQPLHTCLGRL